MKYQHQNSIITKVSVGVSVILELFERNAMNFLCADVRKVRNKAGQRV